MHGWCDIDLSNYIELMSDVVSQTMNSETLAGTGTMWDFIGRPWSLAKLLTLFRIRDTIVRRSQTGKIQHGRLMVAANRCTSYDSCASLENSLDHPSLRWQQPRHSTVGALTFWFLPYEVSHCERGPFARVSS